MESPIENAKMNIKIHKTTYYSYLNNNNDIPLCVKSLLDWYGTMEMNSK